MRWPPSTGWICAATLLAAASSAYAQRAVAQRVGTVVMPFDGPISDTVRSAVYETLGEDPRLDVAPLDEGAPSAQLLISGSTSGRAPRRQFELVASDANGTQLATQSGRIRSGPGGRRGIEDATRALVDAALDALPDEPSPGSGETTEVGPSPDVAAPTPPEAGATLADPAILALRAGVVIRNRRVGVQLQNGGSQAQDFPVYAELTAAAELRPLAHDPGLARGLFVRFDYAHAVGLTTQDCAMDPCQRFDTTFFRLYGDVGFVFGLGGVVEIGPAIGFGFEAYQIADNRIMPGVEYPYLRPALRGRVRVVGEVFVIDADVGYRALFGRESLGTAFGPQGDSFGFDAGLGLGGLFDMGLLWRADFAWASYWHSFAGGGALQTGESGTDQGVRVGLTLGYGLR